MGLSPCERCGWGGRTRVDSVKSSGDGGEEGGCAQVGEAGWGVGGRWAWKRRSPIDGGGVGVSCAPATVRKLGVGKKACGGVRLQRRWASTKWMIEAVRVCMIALDASSG